MYPDVCWEDASRGLDMAAVGLPPGFPRWQGGRQRMEPTVRPAEAIHVSVVGPDVTSPARSRNRLGGNRRHVHHAVRNGWEGRPSGTPGRPKVAEREEGPTN
jgi:hypothetical protein